MYIETRGVIGGDWFCIIKSNRSNYLMLDDILDEFDFNDYWIYKRSGKQREVSREDVLKYSGVLLFNKQKFNKYHNDKWIHFLNNEIYLQFIDKPFPNFDPYKKIIIKK